jgi:uncharacterized membrane protein YhaH (DUF805 family)
MFRWTGALDRSAYAWRSGIAIAFLVATIAFFPFVIMAIVRASHCAIDTCGAVGLVVPTVIRPILFVAAIAMVLGACIRRARDAGLNPWLGAFPPLMLAGDQAFLQFAGAGWAYPFSAGILSIKLPIYALFGTATIVLLGLPARDALRRGGHRVLDRSLLVLAGIMSIAAALRTDELPLFVLAQSRFILLAVVRFEQYAPYAMPLFLVLAAYRIHQSRGLAPLPVSTVPAAAGPGPNLWQPGRAALIGATITVAIVLWSLLNDSAMTFQLVPSALPAFLLTAFPTFVIYTALAASVTRLMARRDAIAAAALLIALVPFAAWGISLSSVLEAKAQERADIAAIPKVALPANARAVVIDGENGATMNCARVFALSGDVDFSDVLTHGQSKSPYLRFTRATVKAPVNRGEPADSAPAEYVLIHFPHRPDFLKTSRMPPDSLSPPVEIYAVDASGTRLVAATYTVFNRPPAFPPMLTTFGWYHGNNSSTSEQSCSSIRAFLQRELLDKLRSAHG